MEIVKLSFQAIEAISIAWIASNSIQMIGMIVNDCNRSDENNFQVIKTMGKIQIHPTISPFAFWHGGSNFSNWTKLNTAHERNENYECLYKVLSHHYKDKFIRLICWKNIWRKILCRVDDVLVQEYDMNKVALSSEVSVEPQIYFRFFSSVFSGVEQ